eukprot:s2913_g1.t4
MQCWLISVVVVAISTMILLFIFSFDSLEYQQIGLNYSFLSESVEKEPYKPGRYYLGVTNRFIKFPRTVQSISFIDDWAEGLQGPALQSRTKDGLTVLLEVSFQYKLIFSQLYSLWATLGHDHYETTFTRMAMEQLSTATTHHNAHFFFRNRTYVSREMHRKLDEHFRKHALSEVPFFQLRTVHLPDDFEDAIRETQVQEQHIHIARLEQQKKKVTFATEVLKAEQAVKKINNEAEGEATARLTKNRAYCEQYKFTQEVQADALEHLGFLSYRWAQKVSYPPDSPPVPRFFKSIVPKVLKAVRREETLESVSQGSTHASRGFFTNYSDDEHSEPDLSLNALSSRGPPGLCQQAPPVTAAPSPDSGREIFRRLQELETLKAALSQLEAEERIAIAQANARPDPALMARMPAMLNSHAMLRAPEPSGLGRSWPPAAPLSHSQSFQPSLLSTAPAEFAVQKGINQELLAASATEDEGCALQVLAVASKYVDQMNG